MTEESGYYKIGPEIKAASLIGLPFSLLQLLIGYVAMTSEMPNNWMQTEWGFFGQNGLICIASMFLLYPFIKLGEIRIIIGLAAILANLVIVFCPRWKSYRDGWGMEWKVFLFSWINMGLFIVVFVALLLLGGVQLLLRLLSALFGRNRD